ncbi:MAG: glutathione S-transferase [Alphaproteobacteria bacterium]
MRQNSILYSFRRCPYAMRARVALKYSGQKIELREILLRDKPAHMLEISPKGTVPVLWLTDDTVVDESLDVIDWALSQNDPEGWTTGDLDQTNELIIENDTKFKFNLDRYKYPHRYEDQPDPIDHRNAAEETLQKLEGLLSKNPYLLGTSRTKADVAIFPFIRQFSMVDENWFASTAYPNLKKWLQQHLEWDLYQTVMEKRDPWTPEDAPIYL